MQIKFLKQFYNILCCILRTKESHIVVILCNLTIPIIVICDNGFVIALFKTFNVN